MASTAKGGLFFLKKLKRLKIREIIELEQKNDKIILHRDGIFYKAYEISAYIFIHQIKQYEAKTKYYKNIKQDIVYMVPKG